MTFFQRLKFYLAGFGLGIVVVLVMFRQRGCEWTPGNRVIEQIATSQILISDSIRCVLKENKIEEDAVFKLLQNGEVVFDESRPRQTPKYYVVESEDAKFKLGFVVRNDSVSVIDGVVGGKKTTCDAGMTETIFNMPEKTVKRILKTKELSAADSIFVQLEKAGLSDSEIYTMIGKGKINFSKSTPTSKPHPIYYVNYKNYEFKIEMAEEKTRILVFTILHH